MGLARGLCGLNLVQKGRLNKRQRDALRRMLDDCQ